MSSRRTLLRQGSTVALLLGAGCTSRRDSSSNPDESEGSNESTTGTKRPTDTATTTTPDGESTSAEETTTTEETTIEETTAAGPFSFVLTFDPTIDQQGRNVSVRCSEMTLYGGTGHELKTYDVGEPTDDLAFEGAFDPESGDARTWRWFGERVTIEFRDKYEDSEYFGFSGVELTCALATTDPPVTGTIHADESHSITFDEAGWNDYFFSFHGDL